MKIEDKKIGILGAGLIGSEMAQVCATHDYSVTARDISNDILSKANDDMHAWRKVE